MNENMTYRTCLYGIDALAIAEYGVRAAVVNGGAECGFRNAWLETDGRVCFMTHKPTDENILGMAGEFLLGMAKSLVLVNAKSARFVVHGRDVKYGPHVIAFVGKALSTGRVPSDASNVIAELGNVRAEAMTSPMDPVEVELALNFDAEYDKLVEDANAAVKAVLERYAKADAAARQELKSKQNALSEEKTAAIKAIRSGVIEKAVEMAKNLGVDFTRHVPHNSDLAAAVMERVQPAA